MNPYVQGNNPAPVEKSLSSFIPWRKTTPKSTRHPDLKVTPLFETGNSSDTKQTSILRFNILVFRSGVYILHPWKHWKIPIFNRKYSFIHGGFSRIFHCHVSFRGCKYFRAPKTKKWLLFNGWQLEPPTILTKPTETTPRKHPKQMVVS